MVQIRMFQELFNKHLDSSSGLIKRFLRTFVILGVALILTNWGFPTQCEQASFNDPSALIFRGPIRGSNREIQGQP